MAKRGPDQDGTKPSSVDGFRATIFTAVDVIACRPTTVGRVTGMLTVGPFGRIPRNNGRRTTIRVFV